MVTLQSARTFTMAALLVLFAPVVSATNFDVSHLANELNRVSGELADQLRNARGYSSVRFAANQLKHESADLVRELGRGRSVSAQRAAFKRVARRYRELEAAFLRSSPEHDRLVYNQVGVISNLFSNLNSEFYYTNYVEPAPQFYYYVPPVVRGGGFFPRRGRNIGQGRGDQGVGGYGGRNNNGSSNPRPGYRPNTVNVPFNNFSHRSSVLERQQRNQIELGRGAGILLPNSRRQQ